MMLSLFEVSDDGETFYKVNGFNANKGYYERHEDYFGIVPDWVIDRLVDSIRRIDYLSLGILTDPVPYQEEALKKVFKYVHLVKSTWQPGLVY